MKLGEEKVVGRHWVSGYRCLCGKLFEAARVGYYAVIPAPDTCPSCGSPRRYFEEGSILLENYAVREKLWWWFRYIAKRYRYIEFRPSGKKRRDPRMGDIVCRDNTEAFNVMQAYKIGLSIGQSRRGDE